ncbi:MAG: Cna B-type domain-containing protein [Clostridia bacterium]|nr:Cna B-type domain-containing protein [Clostridia bacterium]NCD01882.1 Cna B-type domain-containing protein [Clostridia bacterium]
MINMKKGFLKRALALVVCAAVSVTSMPATAFAEGMESAETLDIETQEETVQTYESVEPTTESETESETDTEPVESEEPTETVESKETTTESIEEDTEPPVEITEKTGQIKVSWTDESDLSQRRFDEEHPEAFLTIYADGEKMEVQPEMELESSVPEETEEAQIYTYNIKKLPVMQEDGVTPITYTVKEEAPAGYEKTLEEVKLVAGDDETKLEGEKTFENTLPAYQVSGSISWKTTSEDAVHPEMEAYFAKQFIIVRQGDGEKYETYKIDYAQDDEDSEKWNYSVKGLFTTSADGSQAFYRIQPTAVEGFLPKTEGIDINGDTAAAEFIYSESQSNSDTPMLFAAGRAATAVPSAYEDKPINIFWLDNTDAHPAVTLEAKFTIGENTYTYNKENALTYLGITEDKYKDFVKQQGTGTYDAYLLNVPTKVAVGEAPAVDVTWELNQTATAGTNYLKPEYKETQDGYSNVWINREKDNSSFIVDVKDGITDRDVEAFAAEIHLWGKVGANTIDFGPLSGLTNKVLNSTDYPVEYDKAGAANGDGTYTVRLKNLPEFNDDKVEIVYYLQATGDKLIEDKDNGDYYKPSYDNKNSTNFGSNITECHDGGSLILTIMGKTDYSATKVWLDDGSVERPDSTLYLWRYTIEGVGSSYKEAAQVTDAANNNISISVGKASNIVPCKLENLDKYDPEGYLYRYLTLESLSGTNAGIYEQVHLQSYTEYPEKSGTVTDIVEQDRNDDPGDRSIYDDGIIANRITGQTTVAWKKIWKAAHYQDDLSNIEVTLGLQQREKSTTARADAAWTDTTTTQKIDNFIAENLIQGGSVSVSQYSELGIPLEYQWVEKEIKENGVAVDIGTDGRFELSHNKAPENLSKNGKTMSITHRP